MHICFSRRRCEVYVCELAGFLDKRAGSAARLLELPDERRLVLVRITKPLHVRYRRAAGGACDAVAAEMGALELHLCLCDVLFVQHLVRLHSAMLLASPLLQRLRAEREAREAKLAARLKSSQNKPASTQLQAPTPAPASHAAKSASGSARSVSFQLNAERVLLDWLDDPLPPACVATPLARLELADIDLQLLNGPSSSNNNNQQQQQTSSSEQVPSRALSPAPTTHSQSLSASDVSDSADVQSSFSYVSTDLRLSAVLRADIHNRFANAFESLVAPWGAELSLAIDVEEAASASAACAPGSSRTASAAPSRHLLGRLSASEHLMLTLSPLAIDLVAALLAKLERVQSQSLAAAERSGPKQQPPHASASAGSRSEPRQRDEPDLRRATADSKAAPLDARGAPATLRSLSPSPALFRHSTHVAPGRFGLNALLLPATLLPPTTGPSVDRPAAAAEELGPDAEVAPVATPTASMCASPEKSAAVAPLEPLADESLQFDEYARLHCTNLLVHNCCP